MIESLQKLGLDDLDVEDLDAVEAFTRRWLESLVGADGIRVYSERSELRKARISAKLLDAALGKRVKGEAEDLADSYRSFGNGIIDIVLGADGEPVWLVADENGVRVAKEFDGSSPWPVSSLPWQTIPDASQVMECLGEGAQAPFEELVALLQKRVVLPEPAIEWARLLAAWQCATYMLEDFRYFPLILLEGPPERGKTRLGKALLWPSYRGFYTPSPTPAILFRDRAHHRVSLLLDVEDLPFALGRGDLNDLILNSFERDGIVRRCTRPEASPERQIETFVTYGPTVLISNRRIRDQSPLISRCIRLSLPEAGNKRVPDALTPAEAVQLRARLLAWRASFVVKGKRLPQVEIPFAGRLRDLARPLLQVMKLVAPEHLEGTTQFFQILDDQRRNDTSLSKEARVARSIWSARDLVSDGRLYIRDLLEVVNSGVGDRDLMNEATVGLAKRSLGLHSGRGGSKGRTYIEWPGDEVAKALHDRYSVEGAACPSDSSASSGTEHPEDPEQVLARNEGHSLPVVLIRPIEKNGSSTGAPCIECGLVTSGVFPICHDCTRKEVARV